MMGFHERFDRNEKLKISSDRSFALLFAGVFLLIGVMKLWVGHGWWLWWMVASLVTAAISLARPALLHPLNKAWTKLGLLLFAVISPLAMLLLYVTTFVPIGLVMRIAGKDPLKRTLNASANTYWIAREKNEHDSMKHQF